MGNFLDINQYLLLPQNPGVYKFHNSRGKTIYVGKAKNLKKRVSSYFSKSHLENKTRSLVRSTKKISYTIVESESDALLMENNFIKFHQPKYNILLKDDKTFPWIKITNETFPRIISTRQLGKDGSEYLGPFTNVKMMKSMIELVHELFQIRTCKLDLKEEKINQGKFKECLDYHLKKCLAPCIGIQSQKDYEKSILKAKNLLKGEFSFTRGQLLKEMEVFSSNYDFESADFIKKILHKLDEFQTKSSVVVSKELNLDVFVWDIVKEQLFCHYMIIREGAIINAVSKTNHIEIQEDLFESINTILFDLNQIFQSPNKNVLTNRTFKMFDSNFQLQIPLRGVKKTLLDLAYKNLTYFRIQNQRKISVSQNEIKGETIIASIKKELNLNISPIHIECFDNSNFQGTNAVSACVVFKMGKPMTSEYRHYNIKSVEGPDDFKSMREVVIRRYSRLIIEKKEIPQLVVIDGGKGQLSAAYLAIKELDLLDKVQVIGLAKKREEIFLPGVGTPVILNRRSIALKVIQQLRNEAHRFSLKHHRNKRSKDSQQSVLDTIDGIGKKTKDKLLLQYKSLKNLKQIEYEDLKKTIGPAKASIVYNFLHQSKKS